MPITTSVTVGEVIGRIGTQVNAAANITVRPHNIKKILKLTLLNLSAIMPNLVREYLTQSDSLTLTAGTPWQHLDLTGITDIPDEVHSVVYMSGEEMEPYKRAISLEHFAGLKAYDEDAIDGRYWFQNRGNSKLLIFQGTNVKGQENTLYVGYTRLMNTDFSNKSAYFDCPPSAVKFVIAQCVVECLIDKKAQVPDYLGQDLQNQQAVLAQLDAAVSNQFRALEGQGADIR